MNEESYEKEPRAGLIPYLRGTDGTLLYLMMVSSNPIFGGPRPMISKGKIENDEGTLRCAIREAEEELGLVDRNMRGVPFLIEDHRTVLKSGAYQLTVYAVEIFERWDFESWCEETEYTVWVTLEDFRKDGRRDHVQYLEKLEKILRM